VAQLLVYDKPFKVPLQELEQHCLELYPKLQHLGLNPLAYQQKYLLLI
jgi:hypothetical protein